MTEAAEIKAVIEVLSAVFVTLIIILWLFCRKTKSYRD